MADPHGYGRFGSGHSVRRIEDPALVTGRGAFVDDFDLDGQAQLCFLRSPHAHARIVSIDASAAMAIPGVVAVLTGDDLVRAGVGVFPGPAGFKRPDGSNAVAPPRRPLAHERVRFVGEAVAAIVAATREAALDARDAVVVEYEELPAVVDLDAAIAQVRRWSSTMRPAISRRRCVTATRQPPRRLSTARPTWCRSTSSTSAWRRRRWSRARCWRATTPTATA